MVRLLQKRNLYSFLSLACFAFISLGANVSVFAQCPKANSCTPGSAPSSNFVFGMGIYNVNINTINFTTTGVSDGYRDYSCTQKTTLTEGVNYNLSISTNTNADENVRVWIDLDNDGVFNATSELVFSSNNKRTHTGTIAIPTSAVKNTVLRMRVSADYFSSPIPTPCSTPVYSQVEDYGVTVLANVNPPATNFTSNVTTTCNGVVNFTDISQNTPTSWTWNFGDGTTSNAKNPTKTYTTPGTYAVSLTACNAAGCSTATKPAYITYHTNVPKAALCTPQTTNYCCGYGIYNVSFAGMNNSSADASAGYEDFTCTKAVTVTEGVQYAINIQTNSTTAQDTRVFIDYNNDGTFNSTNELVFVALNKISPTGNIIISGGGIKNTPLRMRILSDFVGSSGNPCANVFSGQAEDYTITILPNTNPPVANFISNHATECDTIVQFTDQSLNLPTSWNWNFGDGTTSTLQNPLKKYAVTGTYTVSLTVCNSFGCNTSTQTNLIKVSNPCVVYCQSINHNNTNSWITNVKLNTINNTSGRDPQGYGDYTAISTSLMQGSNHTFSTTFNNTGTRTVAVWIDFNRNGTFEASEQVATGNATTNTFSQSISIPSTAVLGLTRMRVIMRNGPAALSPCLIGQPNAEVEDYNINIITNTQPPVSNFTANVTTTCTGTIMFTDNSTNTPTSWNWTFGDGGTSTQRNPRYTYTAPGTYTVTLRTCNANGCHTETKTNYITVTGVNGPASASCSPKTTAYCCGLGIYNVTFNTINNTTPDGAEGYKDYSCTAQTTVDAGSSYAISVRNGTTTTENVRVWIDFNDNGVFDPTTELVFSSNAKTLHTGNITIPTSAVFNKAIRMRVSSDWSTNPAPGPCSDVQYGQVEDYSVIIRNLTSVPKQLSKSNFQVFPNPSTGKFNVLLPEENVNTYKIVINNIIGDQVQALTVDRTSDNLIALDLSAMAKGIYFVKLSSGVSSSVQKIIIE